jgi:hypothetical protein
MAPLKPSKNKYAALSIGHPIGRKVTITVDIDTFDGLNSKFAQPFTFETNFYYRRYSRHLVNNTPTLHWGQATKLCALPGLYKSV